MIELFFLENFVEGREHGEITAAWAPCWVIGGDGFLGEFFARRFNCCRYRGTICCFTHF